MWEVFRISVFSRVSFVICCKLGSVNVIGRSSRCRLVGIVGFRVRSVRR